MKLDYDYMDYFLTEKRYKYEDLARIRGNLIKKGIDHYDQNSENRLIILINEIEAVWNLLNRCTFTSGEFERMKNIMDNLESLKKNSIALLKFS